MVSVAKIVRAFTEALHFIKTNKEETKTLLDDIAKGTPKAATADPKSFVDMSWFRNRKRLGSNGYTKGESHRLNSEYPIFRSLTIYLSYLSSLTVNLPQESRRHNSGSVRDRRLQLSTNREGI
jgi:hypothetical protein